ncbi:MAG: TetR/AcrR family transcriptional regulator [bacterium]|uniref:TetR/AcrR family transcriptional regulator n=1 Tax=Candidatus Aphodosoma intestinipullorum TaxID=2840674 RepID=A0A940DJV3_9BACT|nr:TetR/AcrR family transcriptional regulator [Candidatus Aphodosoma intestinipullorum]
MTRKDDTRDKIVETAGMLFHRFGYEKTSMDDIARTAHKAKGSLYYHFPSKEHLFCAVIESEIEKLEEGLTPIIEDSSLTEIDRIEQYIIRRMELMDKAYTYHETLRKEFMMYSTQSEEVEKLLDGLNRWEHEVLTRIITSGVERGCFSASLDPERLADILLMILNSLEVKFFLQGKYKQYEATFDSMIHFLSHGLTAKE